MIPLFKQTKDTLDSFQKKRKPSNLPDDKKDDNLEKDIYKEKVKLYVSGISLLSRNQEKVFGIIWGQCSAALQSKIKSLADYNIKSSEINPLWLLREFFKKQPRASMSKQNHDRHSLMLCAQFSA